MKKTKFVKVISLLLAFTLVFGIVSVSTYAAAANNLLVMNDVDTRQGEEFEIEIKLNRNISPSFEPVAALDVKLSFNSEIYSVVSMETGAGITNALASINSSSSNLEKDYIYSTSSNVPGEIKWSFVALKSFTFKKGDVFMKLRFKANDLSDLSKKQDMTIAVTSAAAPDTLADVTGRYAPYTNNVDVEANLTTLCDWEYVKALRGYRLLKFNGEKASTFSIPAEYNDPKDTKGPCPVVSIGSGAFQNCETLTKVSLGKNVAEVGTAAFFGCSKLEKLVVYSETTEFGPNSLYGTPTTFVVKCLKDSEADAYAKANKIKVEYFEDVSACKVAGTNEKLYYSGSPEEFTDLKVYNSKNVLMTNGVDYTATYSDNVSVGKAKLYINGIGEYFGSKTVEFEILCPYHTADSSYYKETYLYTDCKVAGKVVKDCSFCKYHDESGVAPAKEHGDSTPVTEKEPTCTEKGIVNNICKDCGKTVSTATISTKDHTDPKDNNWVTVKEPACGVKGEEVRYCADCDFVVEKREIPALIHTSQKGVVKEPTCKEPGIEAYICMNCKEYDKDTEKEIPVVDHDYQWIVTTEPTCKGEGVATKQCRFCGEPETTPAETKPVPAKGCTGGEWVVTKDATCDEPGVKLQYCVECKELYNTDTIPASGHTEEWIILQEETCTTGLHKVKRCSECNKDIETVKNDAPGHKEGEWKTVTEYSCTQDGLKECYCSVCNEVCKVEEKKAEGHKEGEHKTIEATCARAGAEETYCSVCNEVYESKPIAKLNHTPGGWQNVIEPTCTKVGMKHRVCTVCGEAVDTETIANSGHGNYKIVVAQKPTYRFEGKNEYYCGHCGEYIRHQTIKKLSADIDKNGGVSATDALCILQHATGLKTLTGDMLINADLDGSGAANSGDALIVLQIATGLITV